MGKAASTGASPVAASLRVFGKVSVVVPALVSSAPVSAPVSAPPESPVVAITVGVITAPAATAPTAPITVRRVTRDLARWLEEVGGTLTMGPQSLGVVREDTTEGTEWSHPFRHRPPVLT